MNIPGPVQVRISLCWPSPTRESSSPASQLLFSFNAQPNIRPLTITSMQLACSACPARAVAGGQPPYVDLRWSAEPRRGRRGLAPAGTVHAQCARAHRVIRIVRVRLAGRSGGGLAARPRATIIVNVYRADGDGRMERWRHPRDGMGPANR
jgi:hypothetical protein